MDDTTPDLYGLQRRVSVLEYAVVVAVVCGVALAALVLFAGGVSVVLEHAARLLP